ncbi:KDGP aldolase family protein [Olsenella sp. AM04-33]|uniref:2-dehydro-3-deoxy-phosphogluconate aldolase n=1 Tax=Olsenella sp. AM04-33 TaxID=2292049 RepID=UPI000E4E8456|nr:KDGP aldolase family protein [Olsenella sp. AM04-33]RHK01227.1 oxo-acid lyase [Olsenella sp. AM04-33]
MGINYYNGRVCLNVLGGSLDNARDIYEAAEHHVEVGVLTANYPDVPSAVEDMNKYMDVLEGNLSVGLGGGNPNQWRAVAEVAKSIKANHFNQAFCAVGWTRANVGNDECHINAMVAPSGTPGLVKISTGPISKDCPEPALVPVDTCIAMVKEMGGNSLKFFPMGGLKVADELKAVAEGCARQNFILEPTGGISLDNFEEIMHIILDAGVEKVIPHVYSSIIDKETGCTRIEDVKAFLSMVKQLV